MDIKKLRIKLEEEFKVAFPNYKSHNVSIEIKVSKWSTKVMIHGFKEYIEKPEEAKNDYDSIFINDAKSLKDAIAKFRLLLHPKIDNKIELIEE